MPTHKNCLKEPITEIFDAAVLLNNAIQSHLSGDFDTAENLILLADKPIIREWTESIWGLGGIYSEFKKNLQEPTTLSKELRDPVRMPNKILEVDILKRDGYNCRFCGIPVIRKEVRVYLSTLYPNSLKWGKTNKDQHSAFQAMWVQFDHLVPHARGGKTTLENMIITCAPCNYGRMNFLVEEIGLTLNNQKSEQLFNWDGLERVLPRNNK